MLKDTPHAERLNSLYLAVNLLDIIVHKPADLMFNEDPTFESGLDPDSIEQQRLSAIVEENDLSALGQELVVGAGFRGDSMIASIPKGVEMEAIIESQDPSTVFPELARGSKKKFKAVNIAAIEWVIQKDGSETPYLNVERHIAGYIHYRRFRLSSKPNIITKYGVNQPQYEILDEVHEGFRVVETGVSMILVRHIPYKATDTHWRGISTTKKVKSLIYAINDRLTQIDYILMKHSDPTAYGVDLQNV
ncbi:portal protein, partial [Bacillus sp. HC-TM]